MSEKHNEQQPSFLGSASSPFISTTSSTWRSAKTFGFVRPAGTTRVRSFTIHWLLWAWLDLVRARLKSGFKKPALPVRLGAAGAGAPAGAGAGAAAGLAAK